MIASQIVILIIMVIIVAYEWNQIGPINIRRIDRHSKVIFIFPKVLDPVFLPNLSRGLEIAPTTRRTSNTTRIVI